MATHPIGPVLALEKFDPVTDPEEEVFLLYTNLQNARLNLGRVDDDSHFRGLGHVDSKTDTLEIRIELEAPTKVVPVALNPSPSPSAFVDTKSGRRSHKRSHSNKTSHPSNITLEAILWQDKTALRSRKGDTGSVLWKASIDFSRAVLRQLLFPPQHDDAPRPLLDADRLRSAHVLELGAGTGLLSVLFSPYVGKYTATDIEPIIPLIRKNISTNIEARRTPSHPDALSNVLAHTLDWVQFHSTTASIRQQYLSSISPEPVDLLLIVDCIYHPSLLSPLLTTIDAVAVADKTAVLVVVELRAEDVIREFLTLWVAMESWEIRHVDGVLDHPYAIWLGWKRGP
ncbi:hypothetical protein ONZ45_g16236 [Pleurotus djamor]|nr:hypothetical protein ONZ45_g16236 [Pleurotus djamor]